MLIQFLITLFLLVSSGIKVKSALVTTSNSGQKIMESLHSSAVGGHSGIRGTYQRVKRLFYWPNLKKLVQPFVSEFPICQRAKVEHCHYPSLLVSLPIPNLAWKCLIMDFIEGLPKSSSKNVILVVVDRLTKYAHFIALSHPFIVKTVAQLFINTVFKLHGPPAVIITDRDRIFTSQLWQDIFKSMGISLHYSTTYHP
jgi:hypothetical protein